MSGPVEANTRDTDPVTVSLYADEMKYLTSLMPKSYSLIKESRLAKNKGISKKTADLPPQDLDEPYLGGRRLSRSKKSRDYGAEFGLSANKNNKVVSEGLRKCEQILNLLSAHKFAEPFLIPVDHVGMGLYDYLTVVKEPMDLSTVKKKLKNREYRTPAEFATDVRKIWHNSFLYNQKFSSIYHMTVEMSNYFEKLNKELNEGAPIEDIDIANTKVREVGQKVKDFTQRLPSKIPTAKPVSDKPLTVEEKKTLTQMIRSLKPEFYPGVVDILREGGVIEPGSTELVFDIDKLPTPVARRLERYVKSKLPPVKKGVKKPAPKNAPAIFPKEDLAPKAYPSQVYTVSPVLSSSLKTVPQHLARIFLPPPTPVALVRLTSHREKTENSPGVRA